MAVGFWATYQIPQKVFNEDGSVTIAKEHFGGSGQPLSELGFDTTVSIYAGILALAANLLVAAVATVALRAVKAPEGVDRTQPDEFFADRGDPRVRDLEEVVH
jgi:SSS family solute:Na+ symporter